MEEKQHIGLSTAHKVARQRLRNGKSRVDSHPFFWGAITLRGVSVVEDEEVR